MRKIRRYGASVAAMGAAGALALTGCGGGDPESGDGGPVTLTLATFNEFGIPDLVEEWNAANPDIQVVHEKAATSDEAREKMFTNIAAGSGLADVQYVDNDWMPELAQYSDKLVDLTDPELEGRWVDWKYRASLDASGRQIGYGVDAGPEAICYRQDLFERAGLPTDREEVAALFGGDDATWEDYFEVGRQFVANPDVEGIGWYDSASSIYQAMINQFENPYEEDDDTVVADTNPDVKKTYEAVLEASVTDGLSAGLEQWSDDWGQAFQSDSFATMICPSWMLGPISQYSEGVDGWNVANVFPGGGGNWGGSFAVIPTQSKHPEEAKKFAAWLTAPEQQIKTFQSTGLYPSAVEAMESSEVTEFKNPVFNDAPIGEIYSDRSQAVTVVPHKGPNFFNVQNLSMAPALNRVDVQKTDSIESSWDKFVADVQQYK